MGFSERYKLNVMTNFDKIMSIGDEDLAVEAFCAAEIKGFYFFPESLKDEIRKSVREYFRKQQNKRNY